LCYIFHSNAVQQHAQREIADGSSNLDTFCEGGNGKGIRRHPFLSAAQKFLGVAAIFLLQRRIQTQLKSARGCVGYSLLAHVFAKRFWTLSVWEDEVALMHFVHKDPHREAMMILRRFMGGTEFLRWKITGSALPPKWHEAMERFHGGAVER